MKRRFIAVLAAASVLGLSACGSGSPSSTGGGTASGTAGGGSDLTKVSVGVIPIVDCAPIYLGDKQGFFKEEGLQLDIQTATGGAAIVPGVVSGSFDFAFSNLISVMVAKDKGLDLKFVANGASTTGEKGKDIGGVVVPAGSSIQSGKDLAGKTVSVNNLSNIGDTTIKSVVEKDGGDPKSVKFVEVAFPDAPAALANKQVDAAWILEPFLSKAVAEGGKVVSWNFVEMSPELDIAGYFTKGDTIKGKAELTQKFTRAMNKSLEYAQQHPQEVRDIVGTYTKIDEAARAKIVLPRYRVDFNKDAFKTLGDAAASYGTLTKAPNADELLP
ncbi:ABC-type nitrate/sulfonate/bicarbonate transport systems periplasmic components-like protein [Arthrobacter sp. FB24]|uniref:ABC transporter substrate-binding protein n=1 Tax=Arthrobacter sp. (strain FB24) TaxID=290399 RepID=UPI00005266DC|nr:ABC transporter substrate-binding protein [Arthrobacter sp. FB24]ABK04462.1 ABC-type nitrate/sulfonate/bicarbonate transport systems periplasmic components-like protein [Arthrobacter sp. FB24]